MRQSRFALVLITLLLGLVMILSGCDKFPTSTVGNAPPSAKTEGTLPLIDGHGPPQATPPDSILAKAARFFSGRTSPLSMIAGVSGNRIGNVANSWLGVPYRYGGNSRSGIDCSHLVYQVYHGAGISSYPYLTTLQMRSFGHFICINWPSDAGDIVLFRNLDHTGIYMGGGWMVDADSFYGRVMWDNLNDYYWRAMGPYPVRYMP